MQDSTQLAKSKFLKSKIQFSGHVVDGTGIHTVDAKVVAVKNFPKPQTAMSVHFSGSQATTAHLLKICLSL